MHSCQLEVISFKKFLHMDGIIRVTGFSAGVPAKAPLQGTGSGFEISTREVHFSKYFDGQFNKKKFRKIV